MMCEDEIALARAYLTACGNDPVTALIRSVKDLALARREATTRTVRSTTSSRLVGDGERRLAQAA